MNVICLVAVPPPPSEILLSVGLIGHLELKNSDYTLLICQKLHI